jgi:hypothetical protein
MRKTITSTISVILALVFIFCLASCSDKRDNKDLWADATHTEDKEFGDGAKTITVTVEAQDKSVTFTVHTDKKTVGEALSEHGLIEGEEGPYGLYVKKVNGILADYDVDQTFWSFYIGDQSSMTGVDVTDLIDGGVYKLVREKG